MLLKHIAISVRDLPKAHAYYTKVLGFKAPPLKESAKYFLAYVGDVEFSIFETKSRSHIPPRSALYESNPPGLDRVLFEVDDLEDATRRLESQGVVIEVSGDLPDGRFVRFHDPEGNLFGLVERRPTRRTQIH
jgi:catechol 2,3-dioxygenase-like lactoylglutathione lyase family enzyme